MKPDPSEAFERRLFDLRAGAAPTPRLDLPDLLSRLDARQRQSERGRWARAALIAGNALAAAAACLLLVEPSARSDAPTSSGTPSTAGAVTLAAPVAEPLLCGESDQEPWCRMPASQSPATERTEGALYTPASRGVPRSEAYATHSALVSCPSAFMCTSDEQPTL